MSKAKILFISTALIASSSLWAAETNTTPRMQTLQRLKKHSLMVTTLAWSSIAV
jgi:hypothetical protein